MLPVHVLYIITIALFNESMKATTNGTMEDDMDMARERKRRSIFCSHGKTTQNQVQCMLNPQLFINGVFQEGRPGGSQYQTTK